MYVAMKKSHMLRILSELFAEPLILSCGIKKFKQIGVINKNEKQIDEKMFSYNFSVSGFDYP